MLLIVQKDICNGTQDPVACIDCEYHLNITLRRFLKHHLEYNDGMFGPNSKIMRIDMTISEVNSLYVNGKVNYVYIVYDIPFINMNMIHDSFPIHSIWVITYDISE